MAVKFEKLNEGHYLLDVHGYVCPHPQVYTKKALEKMQAGDTLDLIFDNPSSAESISAMCEAEGNDITAKGTDSETGSMKWTIKKA